MGIIGVIITGFIAGLIARAIKPGNDRMGVLMTTIVGIVGALLGTYLGQAFGWYQPNEGASFLGAVIGSVLVLAIMKSIFKRKAVQ